MLWVSLALPCLTGQNDVKPFTTSYLRLGRSVTAAQSSCSSLKTALYAAGWKNKRKVKVNFNAAYLFVFNCSVHFHGQIVSWILPEDFDIADIKQVLGWQRFAVGYCHYGDSSGNVLILALPVRYPVLTRTPAKISEVIITLISQLTIYVSWNWGNPKIVRRATWCEGLPWLDDEKHTWYFVQLSSCYPRVSLKVWSRLRDYHRWSWQSTDRRGSIWQHSFVSEGTVPKMKTWSKDVTL